ncbi:arsenite efflux transporter metallochaperone ArsD [Yersinia enterocolitica]|uniref:arsenite efflux transporter metallochaperone ArsD n=1 Tax=Yersinia enterocolitica TaxID=630 RepID=UPI003D052BE7
MKTLSVYDPALCCSTGVCGTDVDQALVTFSADVDWLKKRGVTVTRYNLSQQPMAFIDNTLVKNFLENSGAEGLPLILLDGEFVMAGRYPTRADLARWCKLPLEITGIAPKGCCSGNTSCC